MGMRILHSGFRSDGWVWGNMICTLRNVANWFCYPLASPPGVDEPPQHTCLKVLAPICSRQSRPFYNASHCRTWHLLQTSSAHHAERQDSCRHDRPYCAAGRRSEKTSADPVYDSASRYVGLFVLFLFCTVCYTYAACENIGIHRPQMHNGEVARAQLC